MKCSMKPLAGSGLALQCGEEKTIRVATERRQDEASIAIDPRNGRFSSKMLLEQALVIDRSESRVPHQECSDLIVIFLSKQRAGDVHEPPTRLHTAAC